jgi:hypothetical protein
MEPRTSPYYSIGFHVSRISVDKRFKGICGFKSGHPRINVVLIGPGIFFISLRASVLKKEKK